MGDGLQRAFKAAAETRLTVNQQQVLEWLRKRPGEWNGTGIIHTCLRFYPDAALRKLAALDLIEVNKRPTGQYQWRALP